MFTSRPNHGVYFWKSITIPLQQIIPPRTLWYSYRVWCWFRNICYLSCSLMLTCMHALSILTMVIVPQGALSLKTTLMRDVRPLTATVCTNISPSVGRINSPMSWSAAQSWAGNHKLRIWREKLILKVSFAAAIVRSDYTSRTCKVSVSVTGSSLIEK